MTTRSPNETLTPNRLRARMNEACARTALVEGATAPPRPPETMTVAPGVSAAITTERLHAPLFVTAEAASGRTVWEYDGASVEAAIARADDLIEERAPRAIWLCARERVRSWWGEPVAERLERRLGTVAREADARLVVWSSNDDVAVEDRYDLVVVP